MYRKQSELIETPRGIGVVYESNGEFVGNAKYDLKIEQNTITSASDNQKVRGLKFISGRMEIIEGEKDLITEDWGDLTLNLEDGRSLIFFVKHGDPSSGAYQIVSSGKSLKEKEA